MQGSPFGTDPGLLPASVAPHANFSGHEIKASDLHVIGVYSNPNRYQVRARLLREWLPRVIASGASITLVQHAFGDRTYEFTQAELPGVNLVSVRGTQEIWLQYGLYNVGIAHLPDHARYVCCQDTDVDHVRKDWAVETIHMLQHYRVGQTWGTSVDVNPSTDAQPNEHNNWIDRSFSAAWVAGDVEIGSGPYAPEFSKVMIGPHDKDWRSHTGYSWAFRREVLTGLGRLPDWLIAGSSDWHMALGFAGLLRAHCKRELSNGGANRYSQGYYDKLLAFAELCDRFVGMDIGYAPGLLIHGWHGSKKLRAYGGRETILTAAKFDPTKHIAYDVHGLPYLATNNSALREGLRRYTASRNEDSIDV